MIFYHNQSNMLSTSHPTLCPSHIFMWLLLNLKSKLFSLMCDNSYGWVREDDSRDDHDDLLVPLGI